MADNRKVEALLRRLKRDMTGRSPVVTRNTVRGWSSYIDLIIGQLSTGGPVLADRQNQHHCHDQYCYNDSVHACHKEGCNG